MSAIINGVIFLVLFFVLTVASGLTASLFSRNEKLFENIMAASCGLLLGTGLFLAVPEGISSIFKGQSGAINADDADNIGSAIGAFIGLGFCIIFLFDQAVNAYAKLSAIGGPYSNEDFVKGSSIQPSTSNMTSNRDVLVTTVGLSVHSIIDGFVLGIFLASEKDFPRFFGVLSMVLHKFPVSFGLEAYMIKKQISILASLKYMAAFAASTPLSALLTIITLSSEVVPDGNDTMIGKLLLVSSGTFIYTACTHILDEAFSDREISLFDKTAHPDPEQESPIYDETQINQELNSLKIDTNGEVTKHNVYTELKGHVLKVLVFSVAFISPLLVGAIAHYIGIDHH